MEGPAAGILRYESGKWRGTKVEGDTIDIIGLGESFIALVRGT